MRNFEMGIVEHSKPRHDLDPARHLQKNPSHTFQLVHSPLFSKISYPSKDCYLKQTKKQTSKLLCCTVVPFGNNFLWKRHICVLQTGTNMAAGNQQKHLEFISAKKSLGCLSF